MREDERQPHTRPKADDQAQQACDLDEHAIFEAFVGSVGKHNQCEDVEKIHLGIKEGVPLQARKFPCRLRGLPIVCWPPP